MILEIIFQRFIIYHLILLLGIEMIQKQFGEMNLMTVMDYPLEEKLQ
nr:MAG TPA: hypothetical protein [Caudoviricetes sp.]